MLNRQNNVPRTLFLAWHLLIRYEEDPGSVFFRHNPGYLPAKYVSGCKHNSRRQEQASSDAPDAVQPVENDRQHHSLKRGWLRESLSVRQDYGLVITELHPDLELWHGGFLSKLDLAQAAVLG